MPDDSTRPCGLTFLLQKNNFVGKWLLDETGSSKHQTKTKGRANGRPRGSAVVVPGCPDSTQCQWLHLHSMPPNESWWSTHPESVPEPDPDRFFWSSCGMLVSPHRGAIHEKGSHCPQLGSAQLLPEPGPVSGLHHLSTTLATSLHNPVKRAFRWTLTD